MSKIIVEKTRIIGTKCDVYSAWEVDHGDHSTIQHIDGVRYGRVGTRRLPAELEALPARTQERSDAVRAFHAKQYQEAYLAIYEKHPEVYSLAKLENHDMGEITIWEA